MPSPLGHALGGLAAAWAADLLPGRRVWRLAAPPAPVFTTLLGAGGALSLSAAALGAAPDLDLFLFRHRAVTHSVGAVAVIYIVAGAVTGWVTGIGQRSRFNAQSEGLGIERARRVAAICAAAYGSHLLLDWLAVDMNPPYGLRVLWPFSGHWYISGLDVFPQTESRHIFSLATARTNLWALSFETAVMLPLLALVWLVHVKTVARFTTKAARRHHPS